MNQNTNQPNESKAPLDYFELQKTERGALVMKVIFDLSNQQKDQIFAATFGSKETALKMDWEDLMRGVNDDDATWERFVAAIEAESKTPTPLIQSTEPIEAHPIKPFSGDDYQKNAARAGDNTPCGLCGKAVKNPRFYVEVFRGGSTFGDEISEEEKAVDRISSPGYMGNFPVGPSCTKILKNAGHVVIEPKDEVLTQGTAIAHATGGETQ